MHRRNFSKGFDLRRTEIADPDRPNRAGALQIRHRGRGFLDRHGGIGPVHLIEIDDIGTQTPQRILDLLANAGLAGIAERPAVLPVETDLGCYQDAFAPRTLGQRLAHDLLRAGEATSRRRTEHWDSA